MQGQDWNEVVLRKKPQTASSTSTEKAVNAARRQGATVETVKKFSAGSNSKSATPQNAAKLEDDEEFTVKHVSSEVRVPSVVLLLTMPPSFIAQLKKQIQKARIAKGMTQAQLAQAINETPRVIQDYENGKAVPNPQVLNKMSRVLGTTLSNKAKPAAKK